MKIDLLPALAAIIKRYKVTKLYYIVEGDEAFARFQAMMVAQAREKSYDVLDIQVRRLTDIRNENHTRNLLESVEVKDRGSKEERYIVLDFNDIHSYINLLMQVSPHITYNKKKKETKKSTKTTNINKNFPTYNNDYFHEEI